MVWTCDELFSTNADFHYGLMSTYGLYCNCYVDSPAMHMSHCIYMYNHMYPIVQCIWKPNDGMLMLPLL